jgi:hypothetical protein
MPKQAFPSYLSADTSNAITRPVNHVGLRLVSAVLHSRQQPSESAAGLLMNGVVAEVEDSSGKACDWRAATLPFGKTSMWKG